MMFEFKELIRVRPRLTTGSWARPPELLGPQRARKLQVYGCITWSWEPAPRLSNSKTGGFRRELLNRRDDGRLDIDRARELEVGLGVWRHVGPLANELLGKDARGGGDEAKVRRRGVEGASAELGVRLESSEVRVVCRYTAIISTHCPVRSRLDAPLISATCMRSPRSSLPVKMSPLASIRST